MERTPKKTYKVLQTTQDTSSQEQTICLLCGAIDLKANDRRRVWQNGHKTQHALDIEVTLGIDLVQEFQSNIIYITYIFWVTDMVTCIILLSEFTRKNKYCKPLDTNDTFIILSKVNHGYMTNAMTTNNKTPKPLPDARIGNVYILTLPNTQGVFINAPCSSLLFRYDRAITKD